MTNVFICSRVEDAGRVERLAETLSESLGEKNVFWDPSALGAGVESEVAIHRAIAATDVFLAVIGPHWIAALGEDLGFSEPDDYVRRALARAIQLRIPIVPVLLSGATCPAPNSLPYEVRWFAVRRIATAGTRNDGHELGVRLTPSPRGNRDVSNSPQTTSRMHSHASPSSSSLSFSRLSAASVLTTSSTARSTVVASRRRDVGQRSHGGTRQKPDSFLRPLTCPPPSARP